LALLRTAPGVRRAALFGDTIHVTLGSRERDWAAVQNALRQGGVELQDPHPIVPGLEDVFIERTGTR
jgi:hypothetical protein